MGVYLETPVVLISPLGISERAVSIHFHTEEEKVMANNEPMHVYPTPDGNASKTQSTECPAPQGQEPPPGTGLDSAASPAVAAGSDQPSA